MYQILIGLLGAFGILFSGALQAFAFKQGGKDAQRADTAEKDLAGVVAGNQAAASVDGMSFDAKLRYLQQRGRLRDTTGQPVSTLPA